MRVKSRIKKSYRDALYDGNPPVHTVADIKQWGIVPQGDAPANREAVLVELENAGGKEYWLGFTNFYVITRYNRSANYAMSVMQLAEEIRAERNSKSSGS